MQKADDQAGKLQSGGDGLAETEASCLHILAADSGNAAANHRLGLVRHGQGRNTEALELIGKALEAAPNSAEMRSDHGLVLAALGRSSEALEDYDRALAVNPNLAGTLYNRAILLQATGRFEGAIGNYDRVLALRPAFAPAHYNRGIALSALKRRDEAVASFSKALLANPGFAEAQNNRGSLLHEMGKRTEALADFDAALALRPGFVTAQYNRANVLQELEWFAEAIEGYDKALKLEPGAAEIWNGHGTALRNLNRTDEAIQSYDRALAIRPDFGEAAYNRAIALSEAGRYDEAIASYALAIAKDSHVAKAHRNQGFCHLILGRYEQGWPLYEWRNKADAPRFSDEQPAWTGKEDIAGKTLFLHSEQGLGDTIQFSRYAALCQNTNVILSVQEPLVRLLQQAYPGIEVVGPKETPEKFDFHCPLMSLPLAFGTRLESIPSQGRLTPDPQLFEAWSGKLALGKKPAIGLAWRGRAGHVNDRNRSMALKQFLPLLESGMDWLSLQKDATADEQAMMRETGLFKFLGPDQRDFADTAALLSLADLVISVDTSIAHLAGAMGKPVWILLPANPDFRWLQGREDSPWYPSARLFRQQRAGDRDPVVAQIGRELRSRQFGAE